MSDQSSIAAQMIAALAVVEPDLDTSVGSTVRNIIDVNAEQISQAYADNDLAQYQYDVDTLTGSALDAFCSNFGFMRFAAIPATGIATFTQVSSTTQLPNVTIPAGTLIQTNSGITFQTVATYTLVPVINQSNSINIPIQATVGGSATNVAAGSIINFASPLSGINSVTNSAATTGGTDAESDTAFRTRFKNTVFRSFTGTAQSFLGAALDNPAVSSANVIGAVVTHSEQITLTGGTPTGTCVLTDCASVYPTNQYLATDLNSTSSQVTSGTFLLGVGLTNGTPVTTITSQTNVTLNSGSLLTFGPQTAVVSSAVSNSTSIPVTSFTPSASYAVGYTVNWMYNQGGFFTPGVDFSITTQPLLSNPTTVLTLAASGTGSAFTATAQFYRYAVGNFYGVTLAGGEASITPTAGQNITVTIPALPATYPPASTLYIYLYRGLSSGNEQLIAKFPATQTSFVDTGPAGSTTILDGSMPSANTTGASVIVTGLTSNVTAGTYQVQFNYIPATSRNNYAANVLNCVDIYTNGSSPQQASQVINFYYGPQVTNGSEIATTSSFVTNAVLTSGTTYTSITASTAQNFPIGTFIWLPGNAIPAIVNTTVTNSVTIPINSYTPTTTVATSTTVWADSMHFNGFPSSPLYIGRFQRADGSLPGLGSHFIPLSFGPITTLPSTLVSPTGSGTNNTSPATYTYGTNYWLVNETDTAGMSNQSLCGIEWQNGAVWGAGFNAGSSGSPTNVGTATPMTVQYTFNAVPLQIYQTIQQWRLLSHDVMVHQAYPIYLNFGFVVVFASGAVASTVQPQITTAVQKLLASVSFSQTLEASQVLATVLGVPGVLNARYALGGDGLNATYGSVFAIQDVNSAGTTLYQTFQNVNSQATDVQFTNTTYPVLGQIYIKSVAPNAFITQTQFNQPL